MKDAIFSELEMVKKICIEERKRIGVWLEEDCPHKTAMNMVTGKRYQCHKCREALKRGDEVK